MEEIKYRLEHGNPSAVSAATHKLTARIASETEETPTGSAEEKLLWEMLRSPKPFVANAAANAILELVRRGRFSNFEILISNFMAASSHTLIPGAVVGAIGSILDMQATVSAQVSHATTTKKKRVFGIASNAHPFVSLLRASPSFWPHVLGHCGQVCVPRSADAARRAIDGLRPVFMFAFCDPHQHAHFAPLRYGLVAVVEDLFKMSNSEFEVDDVLVALAKDILAWLSFHDSASQAENTAIALKLLGLLDSPETRESAFLFLCSLLLRAAQFGLGITVMLNELEKRLSDVTRAATTGASLLLLAATVDHSDDAHLDQVVGLAHALTFARESRKPPRLTISAFLASALTHLSHRTELEASIYERLKELSLACNASDAKEPEQIQENMFSFDVHVASALEEQRLLHVLGQSDRSRTQWLRTVTSQGVIGVTQCLFRLVAAIAVASEDETQAGLAFDFLAKAAEKDTSLSHSVLALITYRLSRSELLTLRLLKLLPTLASDKGCVGSVLQLINSLAARPALLALRLRLLYDLWTKEPRVYPYLQRALEESPPEVFRLEFQVAKAKVIGDVCRRGADQHGADLLPLLSNLLNTCTDKTETTVCTLALAGILHLCHESVIDIRTTVGVLAPKLWQDERVEVVRKFISLLALPTAFASTNTDYRAFCRQTAGVLWKKATTLENKLLRRACLESVACYPLDDHELAFLPDYCKADLKYPAGYTLPTDGPVPRPEEVLDHIPGDCWIQLLQNCPEEERPNYAKVVLARMTEEVATLPRGVYYVTPAMKHRAEEPANYGHLRETSLLRAAVALLQAAAAGKSKPTEKVLCAILETMEAASLNADRALPPLDWTFLEKLGVADSQPALAAFRLALSQCSSSRSAKFYVRPVLFGKGGHDSRVDAIFRCLSHVTSAFDSEEVSTFVKDAFGDLCFRVSTNPNDATLRERFVDLMRCAASDKKAHNEALLDSLRDAIEAIPVEEEEMFEGVLEATSNAFPKTLLSTEPPEKSESSLRRSLSLRVHLASAGLVEDPLHLLVACVDAAASQKRLHGEVLHAVMVVASKTRSAIQWHQSNKQWLLELMGHIRSVSRRLQAGSDVDSVRLLLDTFAVAVVVFSGTDLLVQPREKLCSLSERASLLRLLPVAVGRLMLVPSVPWRALAPLLSEWMLHVVADETTPVDHSSAIKKCFSAFKHGEDYAEASVWSRLVPYHSNRL